jgi:5'-phosphate synthase pdxT subunit
MTIGVLALQGDYDAHRKLIEGAPGVARVLEVRDAAALDECDGLIIPGGESTTMSRLCDRYELWQPLQEKLQSGMGALGTCAGLIMLSQNIEGATKNFAQKTLRALDVDVARNAYGAQLDSFECDLKLEPNIEYSNKSSCGNQSLRAVFIRAPRITRVGEEVEVLVLHDGEPVAVRQGQIMACAFHPEIVGENGLHLLWLHGLKEQRAKDK